jgi:uncharacterized protein (TIGR03792 family)
VIVEWLRFKVAPEYRERFVQKDDEVWTTFLKQCPGFLRKETWISLNDLSEVMLATYWATLDQQQAIPQALLDETDRQFLVALGVPFQQLEIKLLQLRKTAFSPEHE